MPSHPAAPQPLARSGLEAPRPLVASRISVILALGAALPVLAVERPVPVSPGAEKPGAIAEARCPTFSWAGVPGAGGYELAILRVPLEPGATPTLVTRASLPRYAQSWTPPLGQCLERGQRYAWSVAATARNQVAETADDALYWSPALLFEVEGAPSRDELEQALATIERFLDANGEASASDRGVASRAELSELVRADTAMRRGVTDPRRAGTPTGALDAFLPGALSAPTVAPRIGTAASAPSLGTASLAVTNQIHLAASSQVFKNGDVFLWDDSTGNTALGRAALSSISGSATRNTAIGLHALRYTTGGDTAVDGSYNTAVGYRALSVNTNGGRNTALGAEALILNTTGNANTATGVWALFWNTTGFRNTATGGFSLSSNTNGTYNTASGYGALFHNTTGYDNTAAGGSALGSNTSGHSNTAVGRLALDDNVTGDGNTALGRAAGRNNTTGNDSIFINNTGTAGDDATIKIGTFGVQTTAFLAGDLGLGFSSGTPENRLHVREAINGDGGVPGNHVAQIENTSTGANADVLALKLRRDHVDGGTTVGGGNNFVTFFDGTDSVLGEIQGNDTGGVAYVSGNADFAEWLRRLDAGETLEAGDVVGLYGDAVSRRTAGATRVFVVSTAPIVLGNDPGATERAGHARVALLGQAPVKVRGPIHAGDLLVASGRGDGVATGRAPGALSLGEVPAVVGRALEAADGAGTRLVPALIGLDVAIASLSGRALESALARIERRIDRLEACIDATETTETGARGRSRSR